MEAFLNNNKKKLRERVVFLFEMPSAQRSVTVALECKGPGWPDAGVLSRARAVPSSPGSARQRAERDLPFLRTGKNVYEIKILVLGQLKCR